MRPRHPTRWHTVAAFSLAAVLGIATRAHAFCGFYIAGTDGPLFNHATQVVLMRDGLRTVLSMQNHYQGPPENFALVVPVPVILQKENVKTLPREVFDRVDQLGAPRLVEYWEQDPCPDPNAAPQLGALNGMTRAMSTGGGLGGILGGSGVRVEAQFAVGEYDIVVLSARDAAGLETWLHENDYKVPAGAEPYLRPYVQTGMKFFVAKVDVTKVTFADGQAVLSPLRFHYDTEAFTLPIRLGLINSEGTQDLIVNILARNQRYDVANYENVVVPTNLDVADEVRDGFGSFYAALFDRTLEKHPRAVVTEYAWPSSSCDPCPTPALRLGDLALLGADVLPTGNGQRPATDFVLTRLHTRYEKGSLGADIVFRAAPPITGGREVRKEGGALERSAVSASFNNFQARYAIRHAWTGRIACAEPRRGVWGGPPQGVTAPGGVKAATRIAYEPRRNTDVAALVRSPIPEYGIPGSTGARPSAGSRSGCMACSVGFGSRGDGAIAAALALTALSMARRRRRCARH